MADTSRSVMDAAATDAALDAPHAPPIFVTPFDAGPMDAESACVGETSCPWAIPPDPTGVEAPTPPCLPDGGVPDAWPSGGGGDPCVYYVGCVGPFAATYINGRCVATTDSGVRTDAGPGYYCIFTEPPTFEYCFGGCGMNFGGSPSRCFNPGPTAP